MPIFPVDLPGLEPSVSGSHGAVVAGVDLAEMTGLTLSSARVGGVGVQRHQSVPATHAAAGVPSNDLGKCHRGFRTTPRGNTSGGFGSEG